MATAGAQAADGGAVPASLERLAAPHVESFDWLLSEGLGRVVAGLEPAEIEDPATGKPLVRFWFENAAVARPVMEDGGAGGGGGFGGGGGGGGGAGGTGARARGSAAHDARLFPRYCREAGTTYRGLLTVDLCWSSTFDAATEGNGERAPAAAVLAAGPDAKPSANGPPPSDAARGTQRLRRALGGLPIMVRSSACHLRGLAGSQLRAVGEEGTEFGGAFVCNGIERIIRLLVLQRRHYVMALRRQAYTKRGANYTPLATVVRCVCPDQSSATVRCHYLTDGCVNFAITLRRAEYFIPAGLLLRCFVEASDRELFARLASGAEPGSAHAAFAAERAELLLAAAARLGPAAGGGSRDGALGYLGAHFRAALGAPRRHSDLAVGQRLLRDHVFPHLPEGRPGDKLALLVLMLHKLYALADRRCGDDNPDALTHHELLLPGHLLAKFLQEKLSDCLQAVRDAAAKAMFPAAPLAASGAGTAAAAAVAPTPTAVPLPLPPPPEAVRRWADKMPDVGKKAEYLLNTGNLVSRSGLDLQQATGFTVVAEKLNFFRYLSHFRSVHRGAYFAELRTTTVRKLLPESWGFMCPVHTPDGSPCGLLNHLASACRVVAQGPPDAGAAREAVISALVAAGGMAPAQAAALPLPPPEYLPVVLDGCVVGYLRRGRAQAAVDRLRELKAAALALEEGPAAAGAGGGAAGKGSGKAAAAAAAAAAVASAAAAAAAAVAAAAGSSSSTDDDEDEGGDSKPEKTKRKHEDSKAAAAAGASAAALSASASGPALLRRERAVPSHLEVAFYPPRPEGGAGSGGGGSGAGPWPGLFLFTEAARMARPVRQLSPCRGGALELLGTLEQGALRVRCPDGGAGGSPGAAFTHAEVDARAALSVVASLTPYSDYNQSPRNMYQCQMGKQTMGSPAQAYAGRSDTKLYRLWTPQSPVCRTRAYASYVQDEFPAGTNAVVAVLAYTGYDMEDAMILNKSAAERGFAHGTLIKTECVDLAPDGGGGRGGGGGGGKRPAFAAEPPPSARPGGGPPGGRWPPPAPARVGAFGQLFPQNAPAEARGEAAAAGLVEPAGGHAHASVLGADGLPHVGAVVWPGDPTYSEVDRVSGRYKAHLLKGEEVAVVEQVTLIGGGSGGGGGGGGAAKRNRGGAGAAAARDGPTRANIKLRFSRNPVVGDKFSSRHGQKGVLSVLWPDADMPYAARSGMRPDVLINPHAFPSRMTIGMLVESMAAKSASLSGRFVDASPFQRCDEEEEEEEEEEGGGAKEEEGREGGGGGKGDAASAEAERRRRRRRLEGRDPVRAFGEALETAGYSYYGQETMISGVTGEEMPCDIFMGVVYYQRLRHMVSDKFQVRSYGPVNALTRQPIKGRKFGGGIRFGEMERDALLAHGAAYLLHDRLHACSDYSVLDACGRCGSLLGASLEWPPAAAGGALGAAAATFGSVGGGGGGGKVVCRLCGAGGADDDGGGRGGKGGGNSTSIERVAVPYVFKYLAAELAAMGIKISVGVSERLDRR